MLELPKYILTSLETNKTSLGEHPAFPPEEEEKFIINAVANKFTNLTKNIEITDVEQLKAVLGKLLSECQKIESKSISALEQLTIEIVTELFSIPEDTIQLDVKIVDKVNTDNQRMMPEKTDNFSFDSIGDMNYLSGEIYKRRMLNALVTGAAMYYANNISSYIKELFEIDSELPALYKKIMKYNEILAFLEKDKLREDNDSVLDAGKVDVTMNMPQNMVKIESEGIIFPVLLEETIKGILELAIAHGLPEKREKAEYVIKKSDFKLAELWDMRLGSSLWDIIASQIEELDVVEPNFFLMTLSELPSDRFNDCLSEIFAKTKRGERILKNIINKIKSEKDKDEFDDFIQQSGNGHQIEDGYYTSEELIADCIQESKEYEKDAFDKWFGNSKVVDRYGKPLLLYHASESDGLGGYYGSGMVFYTTDKNYASEFGDIIDKGYLKLTHPYITKDGILRKDNGEEVVFDGEPAAVGYIDSIPEDDLSYFISNFDGIISEDGYMVVSFVDGNFRKLDGSVTESKKKTRKNDKGETVPEKCDKCGSKIGVYIQGEPIYKCTNKKCGKYFGTMPFNG